MNQIMKIIHPEKMTDAEKIQHLERENADLKRERENEYQRGYFDVLSKFGLE